MKKICAVLLMFLLAFSLLGCQNSSNLNVTKVTVLSGGTHSKEVFEKVINEYNIGQGIKDGIYIEYIVKQSEEATSSIMEMFENGTAPDLVFGAFNYSELASMGYITPIDDLPGGNEYLEKYKQNYSESISVYNGKVYTVPLGSTTRGIVYNKAMFKEAGLVDENGNPTPPKTFSQMREYAKKLTNTDKNQYGFIMPLKFENWFTSDVIPLMQSSVGHMGYDTNKEKFDFDGIIPILDMYLGMKEDNSIFPGETGITNEAARAIFANGNIGMKIAFSFDVGVYNDQFPAKIDWGVAPLPVNDDNKKYMQRMSYGVSPCINAQSIKTVGGSALMKVLKFFTSDEMAVIMYKEGVEIPYDWNIVKDVEINNSLVGWKEFAEMVSISCVLPMYYSSIQPDVGTETRQSMFINKLWNGKMTSTEFADYYTDKLNTQLNYLRKENNNLGVIPNKIDISRK